jgi:Transposase DDE domain
MRSRMDYIVTKDEVYAEAESWLAAALKLKWNGYKCTTSCLLQILLLAAARMVSIWAACRSLADAPSSQAVFDALRASLPGAKELERRLNGGLRWRLPKALFRTAREIAIDVTLLPYYGEPQHDVSEIYRSQRKAGTSRFHAYATACVIHKGHRYTLALTRVLAGESMKVVVERLLAEVRRSRVKIKFLLLDRGFFSVAVIRYLRRVNVGFVIPVALRGRQPKAKRRAKSNKPRPLRDMLNKRDGYYTHVLSGSRTDVVARTAPLSQPAAVDRPSRRQGPRRR